METVNVNQLLTLLIFDHVVSLVFCYIMVGRLVFKERLFPRQHQPTSQKALEDRFTPYAVLLLLALAGSLSAACEPLPVAPSAVSETVAAPVSLPLERSVPVEFLDPCSLRFFRNAGTQDACR